MSFSEQIKDDIIKCFIDRKPVLLHSDNSKNVFNRVRLVQKFHTVNGGALEPPVEFIKTKEEPDYDAFIIKKSVILSGFLGGLRDKARTVIEYKLKEGLGQELGFNVQKRGVIRIGRSKTQDWLEPDVIDVEEFNQRREKLVGTNPEAALKLYKKEKEIVDSVPFFYGLEDRENQTILETIWSEVRNHFESTKKVYRKINCNSWNGKKVYNLLTQKAPWVDIPVPGYLKNKDIMVPFFDSILFDYKGTVFLNNLSCDPESEEDDKHYQNIANIIRKKPDCWLIAYTANPEYFPGEFTDPEVFKSFSLSDIGVSSVTEDKNGERKILGFAESRKMQQPEPWSIDKDKLTVYYNYENTKYPIRLADRQFSVFCCLYKKRGHYVKIKTLEKCWKDGKPKYADFVQDCISKIKNGIMRELDKHKVKNYGNIIEPDQPKNTKAYKLVA